MHSKQGRVSTIIFIGIFLLPLIGLLIMDYQVKQANDITGAYALNSDSNYDHALAGLIIAGIGVTVFAVFTISKFRKAQSAVSSGALNASSSTINAKIDKIDKELKRF